MAKNNTAAGGAAERKRGIEEEWGSILSKQPPLPDFPPHFIFGSATSAYQVEGAWNEGGRGPSIWDSFSHTAGKICDGSNGDIAVDQYHRYKEDIDLLAKLGFGAYRFSISWSRIFPDGLGTKMNEEGIAYYNSVINALLERGIQPFVTLYHWDLPLNLHESMGGWLNEQVVKYFAIYAETCFSNFGDRVKNWITINEPLQTAVNGYEIGIFAPGRCEHALTEPYLVAHHQLLAHAEAVSIYRNKYQDKQGGQIGLVVDCEWAEALSDKIEDKKAAARRLDFQLGWYLDPIFYDDYPETMREILGNRLPKFSQKDKELLRNSVDFIGLNHYTSRFIAHTKNHGENCFYKAQEVERIAEWDGGEMIGDKAASSWLYVVPWGIRKVLNYIAQRYNNPPIYVTENGMDDEDNDSDPLHEMLDDKLRVCYYKSYLAAVSQAIKDGTDVRGYFAWSLLDNFEWSCGYTKRFGLIYVDYKNGLSRHLKSSAYWFMQFLKGGGEAKNGKEE
ncbi:unnamed protein product [Camellia sinensis]|uniref:Beta-glucosidase n=1 Tax=Camellia sinensis TaxID=4442 RepID=A0A1Y0K2D0_CAMSI|nr:beta-glucosidase 42 isoform X2 [Camellia sinensis]ARU79072.1 beta-glucosidase 4 GH1 family [Camellia sinensis]